MGVSTVHTIVKETCDVIWDVLQPIEMPEPTLQQWEETAKGFCLCLNFPLCLGALDGKHVVMNVPKKSGSLYFNYISTFSLLLMALVDHDYRFACVDIDDYGSNSDGGVWKHSTFGQAYENGQLHTPPPKYLPSYPQVGPMNHCVVADKAFPLQAYLMKPYAQGRGKLPHDQAIFSYRLSRACRIVENAFGILAQCFKVYDWRFSLVPGNADKVVKATVVLPNYLPGKKGLNEIVELPEGSVPWQDRMVPT